MSTPVPKRAPSEDARSPVAGGGVGVSGEKGQALAQSRFVNPVDETLVCAICLLVPHPTNALQHKTCDHIVCGSCMNDWLKRKDECPKCRTPAANQCKSVQNENRLLFRLMSSFMVHCDHWKEPEKGPDGKPVTPSGPLDSCESTMQWERLSHHFADDEKGCQFHPVPCPHCATKVARGKLNAHIATCGKRKSSCGYCAKLVTVDDQKRHESSDCPKCPTTVIACVFAKYGCKGTFKRCDEDKHIADNQALHLRCMQATAISQEDKLSALEARNTALEATVATLRKTVERMDSKFEFVFKKVTQLSENVTLAVANMCTAEGRAVRFANAGYDAAFNVQLRDKAGRPCDSAGESLVVEFKSLDEKGGDGGVAGTPKATVADGGKSATFAVSYSPQYIGTYSMAVTLNGAHISGSPFTVYVGPAHWLLTVGGQQNVFHPNGISYDAKSELVWVAEYGAHRIQAFRTDGTSVRKIGTNGSGDGQLSCPQAACVDSKNDLLFVCDQGNQRMCVFRASDGSFIRKWGSYGSTEYCFYNPLDVVHDPRSDLLYITDHNNNRVVVYTSEGKFVRVIGARGGQYELNGPCACALDFTHDLLFVTDYNHHRIVAFALSNGAYVRKWGVHGNGDGQLNYPRGVAYDHKTDQLFVTEQSNNRVSVFRSDGSFVRKWGKYGSRSGEFSSPNGIALDSVNSCVFITEYYNMRWQCFTTNV